MNINKRIVKSVLVEHAGSFLTVKEVEAMLNLEGNKAMRKISGYLSRLRRDADIERKKNNIAFKYCFKKSAVHSAYSEAPPCKKAIGDSREMFNGFTFVEPLAEPTEAFCEFCNKITTVSYKAQKDGCLFLLCEQHAKAIDNSLYGYGGRKWA